MTNFSSSPQGPMASSPRLPGLCLVTDSSVSFHAPLEEVVAEAVSGGVGMVQVREKSLSTGDLYRLAAMLRRVTLGKALLMVNDRLDVALAVEADGVHLPSHYLPTCVVKKVGGGGLLVGRAVHSVEEAVVAEGEGVDYLMLGTIYGTASHPGRAPSGPGVDRGGQGSGTCARLRHRRDQCLQRGRGDASRGGRSGRHTLNSGSARSSHCS